MYTTIPILVAITTFMTYIALGNTLNVATALTALALFEILRFPLFMLPTVSVKMILIACLLSYFVSIGFK